jgi:hypothetical protein
LIATKLIKKWLCCSEHLLCFGAIHSSPKVKMAQDELYLLEQRVSELEWENHRLKVQVFGRSVAGMPECHPFLRLLLARARSRVGRSLGQALA